MPIRIKCPKCQTILGVKDSLAGKKANCPKCRAMLSIPMPKAAAAAVAPNQEDAEALAMSAFADEPPKVAAPVTTFVELDCPFCFEPIKFTSDLAGKQAPCPECKRIIKVPLPKDDKPKDWRTVGPRGPTGALRKKENEPEGAWSTADKTRVSTEAMVEAGAIPVKKVKTPTSVKIRRGVLAGVAFVALIGVMWGYFAWSANKRLYGPLNVAWEAAKKPSSKMKPAGVADLFRGVGDFHVFVKQVPVAVEQYSSAREQFKPLDKDGPSDVERDTLLATLMLAFISIGGAAESATTIDWGTVQKELDRTLSRISSPEAKLSALREAATRLGEASQGDIALVLAEHLETVPQTKTGQPVPLPDDDDPKQPSKGAKKEKSPEGPTTLSAPQIALLVAAGKETKAEQIQPFPKGKDPDFNPIARLGYAEGKARKGDFDGARQIANSKGLPRPRLEASLAVAAIALSKEKTAEAKNSVEDALLAFKELKGATPLWLQIQLTRACARVNLMKEAMEVANAIPDKADKKIEPKKGAPPPPPPPIEAKALAQLEVFLALLDTAAEAPTLKMLDETITFKDSVAYCVALQRLARHYTKLGRRSEALAWNDTLDELHRPFVQMGVALGLAEPRR